MKPFKLELNCNQLLFKSENLIKSVVLSFTAIKLIVDYIKMKYLPGRWTPEISLPSMQST